jgi:hypothetical protein
MEYDLKKDRKRICSLSRKEINEKMNSKLGTKSMGLSPRIDSE